MGNPTHHRIVRLGVEAWNEWRLQNPRVQPNLTRINLSSADLRGIDFRGAGLFKANLSGCDLRGALLRQARLIHTDLSGANLSGAHVYGVSAWDVNLEGATQADLMITEPSDPSVITIDNLEVAQFIHLLITNNKIRNIIDTITSKVVLILGRFTPERKPLIECIKELSRAAGLLPVVFDFEGPRSRDLTETVATIAHLAKFVVADLTSPASVPHELSTIAPGLSVPIVPVIAAGAGPYAMFESLQKYPWVLPLLAYRDEADLRARVFPRVLAEVEARTREGRKEATGGE